MAVYKYVTFIVFSIMLLSLLVWPTSSFFFHLWHLWCPLHEMPESLQYPVVCSFGFEFICIRHTRTSHHGYNDRQTLMRVCVSAKLKAIEHWIWKIDCRTISDLVTKPQKYLFHSIFCFGYLNCRCKAQWLKMTLFLVHVSHRLWD